jgi:hypothetical protein
MTQKEVKNSHPKKENKITAEKSIPRPVSKSMSKGTVRSANAVRAVDTNTAKINIGEAFSVGWSVFKEQKFILIAVLILTTIIGVTIGFLGNILLVNNQTLVYIVVNIISWVWQTIAGIAVINILLRAYDKKSIRFSDLFSKIGRFWPYIGSYILLSFITMGGTLLFFVPGIIATVALIFAIVLVVDENMGAIESIKTSWAITNGYKWDLALLLFLVLIINIAGLLAFIIGLIITMPFTYIAIIHVYRKLLKNAKDNNLLPVERMQIVPKVFLWIGILVIPLSIIIAIVFVMIGVARMSAGV